MSARLRTSGLALAAALAVAPGLTACGGGVDDSGTEVRAGAASGVTDDSTASLLIGAGQRTSDAETGRYEMTIAGGPDEPADGGATDFRATGEFADGGARVHLAFDGPPGAGSTEQTIIDGVAYVSFGDTCTSADLSDLLGDTAATGATDPSALLDLLGGVGDGVTEEGREDVRGVATTHLSGTYTTRDALDAAIGDQADTLEDAVGSFSDEMLDAELAVDVFVDDDGLLRRVEIETPGGSAAGAEVPSSFTTIDYFDFGADIDIVAPAGCDALPTIPGVTDGVEGLGGSLPDLGGPELDQQLQDLCDQAADTLADLPAEVRSQVEEEMTAVCDAGGTTN